MTSGSGRCTHNSILKQSPICTLWPACVQTASSILLAGWRSILERYCDCKPHLVYQRIWSASNLFRFLWHRHVCTSFQAAGNEGLMPYVFSNNSIAEGIEEILHLHSWPSLAVRMTRREDDLRCKFRKST